MANTPSFLGASRAKLDDRGRLHLPQRWQEAFGEAGEMVLTAGPMGCLWLLQRAAWQEMVDQLGGSLLRNGHSLMVRSLLIGHAEEVTVDKNQRILVNEALRSYANLTDANATFLVGSGQVIEIWSQATWDQQVAAAKANVSLFDQINQSGSEPAESSERPAVSPVQTN